MRHETYITFTNDLLAFECPLFQPVWRYCYFPKISQDTNLDISRLQHFKLAEINGNEIKMRALFLCTQFFLGNPVWQWFHQTGNLSLLLLFCIPVQRQALAGVGVVKSVGPLGFDMLPGMCFLLLIMYINCLIQCVYNSIIPVD